ncbi:MAG: hypothetical protein KatS3mg082_0202 [Nitrospiraceae bacterium]|nr:MAG: hypothetical protein KatS3mg082_0202 [Nitrospiraceae bacterium]
MIESHWKYTGSRKAKLVLETWEAMLPKFVKVMPIDYKRVLAERKAAAAKRTGASRKRDGGALEDVIRDTWRVSRETRVCGEMRDTNDAIRVVNG